MASSARPITYRMRNDGKFLVDPTAPQMRRERETEWISRSYPPSGNISPIVSSPPSPVLQPEHPPRSQTPDNWNLSSPNASEMPSPMRRALMPMLSLAREAKEESYADRDHSRTTPRRQKSRVKRSGASVAHRRLMESTGLSSDSGIAGSPLCQSPLVALPLPDGLPSASEFERPYFPHERPPRSQQRASPIPSPSSSPLALQPVSSRAESPQQPQRSSPEQSTRPESSQRELQHERFQPQSSEEAYRSKTPERSRWSDNPNDASLPVPLSPGSTLAQTRPASPTSEARASSPTMAHKQQSQAGGKPVPEEPPAVRHSQFYMEDEMVILRVSVRPPGAVRSC
ncbi:hypothetical protein BN946_scf184332.g1 [Trametes cinnabarina]|uniref:Uncharacterized protein n=1 Tax=Pycnoporus cinnabarinus TaxID=5643 RepID=A0A060SPM1_PYCCI|nr:hypothetical protein BN946_scf184332.g1 [Trametes cinnabarina]